MRIWFCSTPSIYMVLCDISSNEVSGNIWHHQLMWCIRKYSTSSAYVMHVEIDNLHFRLYYRYVYFMMFIILCMICLKNVNCASQPVAVNAEYVQWQGIRYIDMISGTWTRYQVHGHIRYMDMFIRYIINHVSQCRLLGQTITNSTSNDAIRKQWRHSDISNWFYWRHGDIVSSFCTIDSTVLGQH